MSENLSTLIVPQSYNSKLNIRETEVAIKQIKDFFETSLAKNLNLTRVSAPLFVMPQSGMNDNLNGVERPVTFDVKGIQFKEVEIVHSLAKWKRVALKRYNFSIGEGLYTDMNAIRRDEDLDNLHSIYVDQWDWEIIIPKTDRTMEKLKEVVTKIYSVLKETESFILKLYPNLEAFLPEEITFITSEELLNMYPDLSPKQRESEITKKHKAVFLSKIGDLLSNGEKHDGRAPDYDDWSLNGDILIWYPLLDMALEISSMGIRVDEDALKSQLEKANCLERTSLPFHQDLLNQKLPYTMGGGIGQSRLCMLYLLKAHIGEVQASIWSDDMILTCEKSGIHLL